MKGVKPLLFQNLRHFRVGDGGFQLLAPKDSVLEDPVAGAGEGVPSMNHVLVGGAGDHHVLEALLESGHLRIEQHLQSEGFRRVLDQKLVVWAGADFDGEASLFRAAQIRARGFHVP